MHKQTNQQLMWLSNPLVSRHTAHVTVVPDLSYYFGEYNVISKEINQTYENFELTEIFFYWLK